MSHEVRVPDTATQSETYKIDATGLLSCLGITASQVTTVSIRADRTQVSVTVIRAVTPRVDHGATIYVQVCDQVVPAVT